MTRQEEAALRTAIAERERRLAAELLHPQASSDEGLRAIHALRQSIERLRYELSSGPR